MVLKTYSVQDINELKVWGRTSMSRQPISLFWTGSGIECEVKASELWIQVEADYDVYEPWMGIMINDAYVSRQMLNKGMQWICVFRGMNPELSKQVRIVKEVQAMSGDEKHCMKIHALRTDGHFMPVRERKYKLEVIGDSITSGEGTIGAVKEEEWISMWFSIQNNYAHMTAQLIDAEYRIISQSGWGICSTWDNDPNGALPLYYEKVCGLLKGEQNEKLGAFEAYDFQSWQPDAIIINLGTNDGSAFTMPEWKDLKTGKSYKQRMNEDGSYNEEDLQHIRKAIVDFLTTIRNHNKRAYILWGYGMLGKPLVKIINEGIEQYRKESGDQKVEWVELPDTTKEKLGARQHPGILAHQEVAHIFAERLLKVLE